MKVEVELDDDAIIEALKETAKTQIWHINYTIQTIRNNYTDNNTPNYLFFDLQHQFETLRSTNEIIKYYGGKPVELFAVKVKVGFDLDGKPFIPK